jgi:hypothetical protein
MRKTITYILLLTGALYSADLEAREYGDEKKASPKSNKDLAVDCAPSTARIELALNNVRFLIETGGNMWEDRAQGAPAYVVPKEGENSVLFAGSLWMGGYDPANNLKLAAVRFRQVGNDYWPGPLTNDGTASISSDVCLEFDKFWNTTKQEAQLHALWWQRINDGDPSNDNDPPFENGYVIPQSFITWPGNGNISQGQDNILGPFFDQNNDGIYNPQQGDYPDYNLAGNTDCRNKFREDPVPLFGDENLFWIFNDKGNIHTESSGEPIGMEVRAQAFAFATSDEINSMTFYNYVLINQGTLTLEEAYFGQWVDCDVGNAADDYVGCDVQRGLGYGFNGDEDDESSASGPGYGANPPAIGVDFFEGPFQDADNMDNPLVYDYQEALAGDGIPYAGIGIGYGDDVIDNERYGMRAFLYHNNSTGPAATQDPSVAIDYYNFLQGIWKDGTQMTYGGTGYDPANPTATVAKYMFPGNSDPIGWGTGGVVQADWSESGEGNDPADRRFIQSAGPFTLEPGNVNNITVGAVYGRTTSGGAEASVNVVRVADDKAQKLFDNCFLIVDGPRQPEVAIREMDKKLIMYLSNTNTLSNNYLETYDRLDPSIPNFVDDGSGNLIPIPEEDQRYKFEGYMIYQLVNDEVSPDEINNPDKARLIYQVDIKNDVSQIINWYFSDETNSSYALEMVNGSNDGISHSFEITRDAFAETSVDLVNFKTYCYMVFAYAYNNYYPYNPVTKEGQFEAFKQSRQSAVGGQIETVCAIPHKIDGEQGGTVLNSAYGDQFKVTRVEGKGTGGNNIVRLEQKVIDEIMSGEPYKANELEYQLGAGPLNIYVVDPLTVKNADFIYGIANGGLSLEDFELDSSRWFLIDKAVGDTIWADKTFNNQYEQLIPDYGIAVNVNQYIYPDNIKNENPSPHGYTDFLYSEMVFEDSLDMWLTGLPDIDGFSAIFNWIRCGTIVNTDPDTFDPMFPSDYAGQDDEQHYETVVNGTWAPFTVVQSDTSFSPAGMAMSSYVQRASINLSTLNSVDVVFTSDKDKWTRCMVLEAQEQPQLAEGGAREKYLREHPSVDRNGNTGTDEATNGGTQPIGFGYFPGYAIDVSTGERLNMAFAEDSYLSGDNGDDMIWNPTDRIATPFGQGIIGGQHYIYVFKNLRSEEPSVNAKDKLMPSYDEGHFFQENIQGSTPRRRRIFDACTWVNSPLLATGSSMLSIEDGLIPNDVTVRIRVARSYMTYATVADIPQPINPKDMVNYLDSTQYSINDWAPLYEFSTKGFGTETNQTQVAENFLENVGIVPNPYYAQDAYETGRLDTRVKLINLPQQCTISIFNMGGTLVRQIEKDNPLTYQDWNLQNFNGVPVAGGVYVIHVDAGNLGETILKFFCVMRPPDLENF